MPPSHFWNLVSFGPFQGTPTEVNEQNITKTSESFCKKYISGTFILNFSTPFWEVYALRFNQTNTLIGWLKNNGQYMEGWVITLNI